MSDPKTMVQAMNEVSAAFKALQRQIAGELTPSLLRLNEQLFPYRRQFYLLAVRRWLPWVALVFFLCVLIGWWIT